MANSFPIAGLPPLLATLRKNWATVLAATLISVAAGVLMTRSMARVYRASNLLEIDPSVARPLGDKTDTTLDIGTSAYFDTRDYYETQYKIVTSDRVLSAVVRDLALASDPDFIENGGHKTASVAFATDRLRDRVTVEPVHNSRLVSVRVLDTNPARAKRICDAIANAYIEQNLQTALNATSDAVVWLNNQVDHVKDELTSNENALYDFKQSNDLPSIAINETANMLRVEMQELDTALTHTRTRRQELLAREAELSKVSPDNPDQLPSSELLGSQFLQATRTQYQEALQDRSALIGEGKGENHPLVRRADEKVATAKAALLAEVRNIQGAVERDLAIAVREEDGEAALFEAARKRAVDLNMKEIEYHRLDRTREQNERLYAMLIDRLKESDLARMMRVNNIRVVDYATEPGVPVRPRVLFNLSLALAFGLFVGVGLAWTRDRLDSSIKTPDDLERALNVTFLGLLPEVREEEEKRGRRRRTSASVLTRESAPSELIVHTKPLSGVAEAARTIRTNITFMNPDRPHRKILVTSAAPSEGKTTVACSIAIALAQGGQRVCIVDCDLRRPRIHRVFDRSGDVGVTNYLVGECTLDDIAKPTHITNLWAVSSGPIPPNPADMLQSERFKKFIDELSERFDRVVVDSPPLVAVTDSAIISTLCDGTVFVVRAFKTSKHLSAQGLRSLRDVDAPVIGAVLNAVNLDRHEYNYYYHYYYYKREGYAQKPILARSESEDHEGSSPPN
jgi:capsular exopolysaccharide synthesis family protein